jgi:diadenosine tetraphosphatase ApaH/serine/threonine PP2A family protein phosphatase
VTYPLTALISDLHINAPALERALADARERGVARFVCLGDVIGYGAKPIECLDLVLANCSERAASSGLAPGLCLQGNHEYALLNSGEDFNPNARRAIDWTREQINGGGGSRDRALEYWDFLGSLEPLAVEDGAMYAHGSPRDPVREYLLPRDARDAAKMQANFARMRHLDPTGRCGACFVGHSHVPGIFYEDGRFYRPRNTEGPYELGDLASCRAIVNVGSVGQPRDGDKRLSYAIFDGVRLTFVRLEYDVALAQDHIRSTPELPAYLADRLALGQ